MSSESFCRPVNCSYLADGRLQAENDVSGIGITISFMGSAGLATLLLVAYYLFVFDPLKDPSLPKVRSCFRSDAEALSYGQVALSTPTRRPNPVDVEFLLWIRGACRAFGRLIPGSRRFFRGSRQLDMDKVFYKSIINISDIQILAGVGALASAYISLGCGKRPMSAYHWQLVANQVWLSSVTHLAGLTIIRGHLRKDPWKRNLRLTFIALVFIAVILSLVPTGYFDWFATFDNYTIFANPAAPAACYFKAAYTSWNVNTTELMILNGDYERIHAIGLKSPSNNHSRLWDSPTFHDTVLSITILIFGAVIRCYKILGPASDSFASKARRRASVVLQKMMIWVAGLCLGTKHTNNNVPETLKAKILFHAVVRPALAMFLTLRLLSDVFCSLLAEVYCLVLAAALGMRRVLIAQNDDTIITVSNQVLEDEREWGYGQILPLLLLVSPLLSFASTLVSESKKQLMGDSTNVEMINLADGSLNETRRQDTFTKPVYRGTSHLLSVNSDEITSTTVPEWLERDYYKTALWIRPCLIAFFCNICFLTLLVAMQMYGMGMSLAEANRILRANGGITRLWLTSSGFFVEICMGIPLSCAAVFSMGLALEPWFQNRRKLFLKRVVVFCLAIVLFLFYTVSVHLWPSFAGNEGGPEREISFRYFLLMIVQYSFYLFSYMAFLMAVGLGRVAARATQFC
ncbi:hypothetical protein HIM_04572 [Hirsutella minnesotensis 3608]|uniref:Transmembrane protein n=1 Tax=Hirsutella minnesotensis 3608 TaxID=1043627 RepID=A0A0F7ZL86_9HYPO|nr:hypothetical protein HIM_04572 [Hirsutella minnesotensis 3608]